MPIVYKKAFHTFTRSFISGVNWDRINRGPLQQAGIRVRRKMRDAIRKDLSKSQKPSKPGKPPKSRAAGHPFRRIFSVPVFHDTSVFIGHEGFGQKPTPMEIHEFGRTVKIKTQPHRGRKKTLLTQRQKIAAKNKYQSGELKHESPKTVIKAKKFPERRFAQPSLDKVRSQLPQLWKNSVRKGVVKSG